MTFTSIAPLINTIIGSIFICYFLCQTLRPKNEKKAFLLLTSLVLLSELSILISPTLHFLTYTVIITFIIIYFKERILKKLTAFLFLLSILYPGEIFCMILFVYIPSMLTGQEIYLHISSAQSNSIMYILYLFANLAVTVFTILTAAKLWNHIYYYIDLSIVCELFLYPNIICLEPVLFLYRIRPKILALLVCILLCVFGTLSIIHGFHRLTHLLTHVNNSTYQKKMLQLQLNNYQQMEKYHLEVRKWNHDISNHLLTVEYLLKNSEIEEAGNYLRALIMNMELS